MVPSCIDQNPICLTNGSFVWEYQVVSCYFIFLCSCAGMLCPILDLNKNGHHYRMTEINRSVLHVHK